MAALQEQVHERLANAAAISEATQANQGAATGTGSSPDREVTITVDGKGLMRTVAFDDGIRDLDAEELREATMSALSAAREKALPPRPAGGGLAALHDDSVSRKFDELFEMVRRNS